MMQNGLHNGDRIRVVMFVWIISLLCVTAAVGSGYKLARSAEIAYTSSTLERGSLTSAIALLDVNRDLSAPLTTHQYNALSPSWSPDGEQIAFVSDSTGSASLYIMDASGKHLTSPLTQLNAFGDTTWLPDGRRIVFRSRQFSTALFNITSGESSLLNIADISESPISWSRDSKWVIYVSYQGSRPYLHLLESDCISQPEGCPYQASAPLESSYVRWPLTWSPDGHWLVFSGLNDKNDTELYRVAVNCTNAVTNCIGQITQLTDNQADDFAPAWSPDGQSIAFLSDRDGSTSIYLMDTQSGEIHRLSENAFDSRGLVWSSDSRSILLASVNNGQSELDLVDAQTGVTYRLTRQDHSSIEPVWRP